MKFFQKKQAPAVLIVCPNQHLKNLLGSFLKADGYEIRTAETSDQGMAYLKKESFDVFIVDYLLQGMNGLNFFKIIQPSYPDAVKILLADTEDENIMKEAKSRGVISVVDRSVSLSSIKEIIRQNLQKSGAPFRPETKNIFNRM